MTDQKMRAVVFEGKPGEMAVRDVRRPKILLPGDVVCRIEVSAICGYGSIYALPHRMEQADDSRSDLHTYHGLFGSADVPFVMGHEAIGIVENLGDGVSKLKKGDRVVIMALVSCGYCNTPIP